MSAKLFENNVKYLKHLEEILNKVKETNSALHKSSVDSADNFTLVTNEQVTSMEQHNNTKHKMFRNNLKAENLKSKIDLLIMSKTKMTQNSGEDDAEENIQSIQEEINNMFTGRLNVTSPGVDVKNSNKPKVPMNLSKAGDSQLNKNHQSHTTVENVEHLLETMFSDNKTTPVKLTPAATVPDSKHPSKKTPTPRNSLSNETIENILRTPSPVDDNRDDVTDSDVINSKRLSNNNQCNKPNSPSPTLPLANNSHPINSTPPSNQHTTPSRPTRSGRARRVCSSTCEEPLDDSSNDSLKLEIDDILNQSLSDEKAKTSSTALNQNLQESNSVEARVRSNAEETNNGDTTVASPDGHTMLVPVSKDVKENNIKQEPNPSPEHALRKKPANSETAKTPIMTVENELEKMFAGIVKEEEESPASPVAAPASVKKENGQLETKIEKRNKRRRSSEFFPSSPEPLSTSTPPKQKKRSKQNAAGSRPSGGSHKKKSGCSQSQSSIRASLNGKDTSNDSLNVSKAKVSPFIRVFAHSKESVVVNSVANIKDEEVSTSSGSAQAKKPAGFVPNKKMRSSAQSNLQPANRTDVVDPTWFCVFCKRGPNTLGVGGDPLGDLFGPYRIGVAQESFLDGDEFKRRANRLSPGKIENIKKKRSISVDVDSSRLTAGLSKVTPDPGDPASSKSSRLEYEVWFHENCIVWGSGVYLVGASLMGLDQCVWAALNSTCVRCGETGASIGCVKSKCRSSVHFSCALQLGWYLDSTTCIATCSLHRDKYVSERYLESPGTVP